LLNQFFVTTLETLINQALRLDTTSLHALNTFAGKIIRIEITGIDFNVTLFPDNQGIIILSEYEDEVDVRIKGAPFTLLRLLLQHDATFSNTANITVDGDINIAEELLLMLKGLDIDWEEQIAQRLGEGPTHKLATLFQKSQNYTTEQFKTLQQHTSEYLQEKVRHLPSRAEMDAFFESVKTLHDDVESLEQRVQRLL
jgi:ubiquinone biosynthesis accessory factor UbiJ